MIKIALVVFIVCIVLVPTASAVWFNDSFVFKRPIQAQCSDCSGDVTMPILINDTCFDLDGNKQCVWCNYTIKPTTSTVGWLYYVPDTILYNQSDINLSYECVNSLETERVEMEVELGNESDYLQPWGTEHVGVWHLNDDSVLDSTDNNNDGILTGGQIVDGLIDGAIYFNGSSNYIDIGAVFQYNYSFSLNFKSDAFFGGPIIGFNAVTNEPFCELRVDGRILCKQGPNNFLFTSSTGLNDGEWHNLVVLFNYNSSNMDIYVDGILDEGVIELSGSPDTLNYLWIATHGDVDQFFNGTIDEVRAYNRELTANEIKIIYGNTPQNRSINALGNEITQKTSILARGFNVSDFTFSSSNYVEGVAISFNTSKNDVFGIMFASNLEKITGGESAIGIKIQVDGVTISEKIARTLSGLGDKETTGMKPVVFYLPTGNHNFTIDFNRSGTGIVSVNNIDLVLVEAYSNDDYEIAGNDTDMDFTHTNTNFVSAFNFSYSTIVAPELNTSTFLLLQGTLSKSGTDPSTASYYFESYDTGQISPLWLRTLSSNDDIGAFAGAMIQNSFKPRNFTINAKQTDPGENVYVDASSIIFDLSDESGRQINFFQESNELSNITSSFTLTEGTHLISSANVTVDDGDNYFLLAIVSFGSDSGKQTVRYYVNSTQIDETNCYTEKENTLEGSDDDGNILMFTTCKNLVEGQNYTFNFYVEVESGETITQYDEVFIGFESTRLNITRIDLPPIPSGIISPEEDEIVSGIDQIVWGEFVDPRGFLVTYEITLRYLNLSLAYVIASGITDTDVQVDWRDYDPGDYNLNVQGCDPGGLCSNTSINITIIRYLPDDIRICMDNSLYIRTSARTTTNGDVTVDTIETLTECPRGCSNSTLFSIGAPNCRESDAEMYIVVIVVSIIFAIAIRMMYK